MIPTMLSRRMRAYGWAAALLLTLASGAKAQNGAIRADYVAPIAPTGTPEIVQTGCASCGDPTPSGNTRSAGLWGYGKYAGCASGNCDLGCSDGGCGENGCVAGRGPCSTCERCGPIGKSLCMFHNALCCPDPCYEPRWTLPPNAALFVDSARPVTQTRFRWDSGRRLPTPRRGGYFLGSDSGPTGTNINYNELSMYTEAATERFSAFVNTPYRSLDGGAGFGDLQIGTKSLILDSDLLQTTFKFTTHLPTGSAGSGAGVRHVSLEPALLTTVKLYPETYFQSEYAYWIPISPPDGADGGVFIFNHSLNHTICRPHPDMVLVGSIEMTGYRFTGGSFVDPVLGTTPNQATYLAMGPGFRYGFCDKLDIGFGMQFALTGDFFARELYRTELRWRF